MMVGGEKKNQNMLMRRDRAGRDRGPRAPTQQRRRLPYPLSLVAAAIGSLLGSDCELALLHTGRKGTFGTLQR
jgi:hypothetical protein